MTTRVSVVTVTYNDEKGLRKTCQSVQNQRYAETEHIIIDGASTDGSLAFLEAYGKRPQVSLFSERDHGIFDAMNKGLRVASGDLVVFMNAADVFPNDDTLAEVVASFEAESWSWAYGSVRYVGLSGESLGTVHRHVHRQRMLELGLTFVPHQTMFATRALIATVGEYREDLGVAADQDYAIRLGLRSDPRVFDTVLCDFEVGGAHSSVGRIRRELLFHKIREQSGRMILGSVILDRAFALANGARWVIRDLLVTVIRGSRPQR